MSESGEKASIIKAQIKRIGRGSFIPVLLALSLSVISYDANSEPKEEIYSPSERPAAAPIIKQHTKDDNYFDNALYGVTKPYPPSLMFLKDQGAWYTPFTHPGMLGPYDIRGWHSRSSNSETKNTNIEMSVK